jgi:hypothetical protein
MYNNQKNSNPTKFIPLTKPVPSLLSPASQLPSNANYDINPLVPQNTINNTIKSSTFQKTFDLKSADLQFLSSERSARLLNTFDLNQVNTNFSPLNTKSAAVVGEWSASLGNKEQYLLSNNVLNWANHNDIVRLAQVSTVLPTNHIPLPSSNPTFSNKEFDFIPKGSDSLTPPMLRSKEESAPSHIFSAY